MIWRVCALLGFLMGAVAQGHVVEQFYGEFEEGEDGAWTLELPFAVKEP